MGIIKRYATENYVENTKSVHNTNEEAHADIRAAIAAVNESAESVENKVDAITTDATNEQYPSAKATRDFLLDHSTYVTPEMYGAIGDGETDDTAAIQAAINAATNEGKIIYLYKKTYTTTAPLVFNISLTKFICDGIIKYTGTEQAILVTGQNIIIDINQIYAENGTAVEFNAKEKSVLYCDVHVANISSSTKGFRMYTNSDYCISYNKFSSERISATDKGVEIWADTQWINENTISPGVIGTAIYGIYIYSNPALNISGGYGANDTTFIHGAIEGLQETGTAIYLSNTTGNSFEYIRCQENFGSTMISFNGQCSYNNINLSHMRLDLVNVINLGENSFQNVLKGDRHTLMGEYPAPRGIVDSRVADSMITYNPSITNVQRYVSNGAFVDNILGHNGEYIIPTQYRFQVAAINGQTFTLSDIYSHTYSDAKGTVVTLTFSTNGGRVKLVDCNGDLIIDNSNGDYANQTISVQWAGYEFESQKNIWLVNANATETTAGLMSSEDKVKLNDIPDGIGYESYLNWGGKNLAGTYSPVDAAIVSSFGANRFAFMPTDAVAIEYSTDNGVTWENYTGNGEDGKTLLCNDCENSISYYIGGSNITGIDKSDYMLRVTIDTTTATLYSKLNKFMIYCATNGSSGCYCTVSARTNANYSADADIWTIFADHASIDGWNGYNIINTDIITTSTSSSQYREIRFEFGVTSHPNTTSYSGLRIMKLQGYGEYVSGTSSTLAKTGHLYSYDHHGNATFPKNVIATAFEGVATKAYKDNAGNVIHETYMNKSGGTMTGALTLAADPTKAMEAATKQYVDDTTKDELSEVLTLIENNKETLESLTANKINVSDIVNNLTTNSADKVLSAAQGVVIKGLIDALQEELDSNSRTITANASDDDIVVLTGTNGINEVTYSASHADSGVTAGTYKSVTVNAKGHVTAGTNPTTLEGYGITNAYTKTEIDNLELITTDDIDAICGGTIKMASEVTF